jgi:hypothetical protein
MRKSNDKMADLHNAQVKKAYDLIVSDTLRAGGDATDILVMMESLLLGVIMTSVKLGGDEKILDTMVEGVKKRLAEKRLGDLPTAGKG